MKCFSLILIRDNCICVISTVACFEKDKFRGILKGK